MNFQNIPLKNSYESQVDDLVLDFYIPMLSKAKRYDRISGFFSSTSLALSARGLAGLINNNGKMRLITCPRLSAEDADIINRATEAPEQIISNQLITNIQDIQDQFQLDHIRALGWMLAKGFLQIKIALVQNKKKYGYHAEIMSNAIVHQKVGLLYDEDFNGISFSGSNNESASGWLENIEEFKVFKQWDPGQNAYFCDDQRKFAEFWDNKRIGTNVIDLPTAVKEHLIEIGAEFNRESIALNKYYEKKQNTFDFCNSHKKAELKLFFYQKEAVNKWLNSSKRLLLEMATGCGKTRTAIGCIQELLKIEKKYVLVVIACPQNTLSMQWKHDIESLETSIDFSIICDGNNHSWQTNFSTAIKKLASGFYKNLVIYTTHKTCSSKAFLNILSATHPRIKKMLIGDEVHGMGAPKTRFGLSECYNFRLGLSATPSRWFDEDGSVLINDYFGPASPFKFTIQDALTIINPITGKPFLVNFYYYPRFICLTEEELQEYKKLSERIIKLNQTNSREERAQILEFLLFKRASIEKNAENKYQELEKILLEIGLSISDTIIFVSDGQIDRVMNILAQHNILAHRFTKDESTARAQKFGGLSEREYIIQRFSAGDYKVLVAIKCLDEGIDIPSAKRAIVMASSTNPREYIQRIGRIIRQTPYKKEAHIYDLIIRPDLSEFRNDNLTKFERKIFEKEMERVKDLSANALNNAIILQKIYNILGGFK